MIKVHISPDFMDKRDTGDGGIRRVAEAMIRHFPAFGIEHTRTLREREADVLITHGAMPTVIPGVPILNVNHGLMWSRQPWEANFQEVNEQVVEAMRRAQAHTVPSEWVGRAVRRGGFFYPEVVYHGVDASQFVPPEAHGNYVLWNKARADYVSNPQDMQVLAHQMQDVQFHSTIGRATRNVTVLGVKPYDAMKQIVAGAGVYLCTVRETFGIGTLEAMAMGVPVAGWNWGGQSEIIQQGQTGYLAPPGDYKALQECVRLCFSERQRLSANCVEDVRTRWGWEPRIEQYAEIVKRLHRDYNETERPKVSVIVTTYRLDKYLRDCLNSVAEQRYTDFECLVVDDAQQESTRRIVEEYGKSDQRFSYRPTPHNLGLAGARNYGLEVSRGRYIRHLDADDYLDAAALGLEADALDADPAVHIVYGHLEVINEDGSRIVGPRGQVTRSGWPDEEFSWVKQMAHLNQLPSCVMMRREVQERSGGYRERMWRNEDAEFWCRVTSLGFRARKITQSVTYYHRMREDSKGAQEWASIGKEPDWTAWFPWRLGATEYGEATRVLQKTAGIHPKPYLVPFGAQGKRQDAPFWFVHDFAYPVVSVVVTCGPGHEKYLLDALDSVQAQTYPDWECVVVNDTGQDWASDLMGAPWAKVVNLHGNHGVAYARNHGLQYIRGRYVIYLDADDYWMPWTLEMMMAQAEGNPGAIIYSDFIEQKSRDEFGTYRYADFDPRMLLNGCAMPGSSTLIPREALERLVSAYGGWDERIVGMEDWDFQFAMCTLGVCPVHVAEPLFVYRRYSTTKRESDYAKIDEIVTYMKQKWAAFMKGERPLMCGCATKKITTKPASTMSASGNFDLTENVNSGEIVTQMVQVEYVGPIAETFTIRSRMDRNVSYRFGNNEHHKLQTVYAGDAEYLTGQTNGAGQPLWRMVASGASMDQRDPSAFLGQAVAA